MVLEAVVAVVAAAAPERCPRRVNSPDWSWLIAVVSAVHWRTTAAVLLPPPHPPPPLGSTVLRPVRLEDSVVADTAVAAAAEGHGCGGSCA